MKILGISTSSYICSVALLENEILIDEININDKNTHSEKLMPCIDKILTRNNTNISNINLIAVDIGPGSFTGLRIGISSVKALALPFDIPIVGISSLEALKLNVDSALIHKDIFLSTLIDARNRQVYFALFDYQYNIVIKYQADDIGNILDQLKNYPNIVFIGDGAIANKDILSQNKQYIINKNNDISAKNIALLRI